MKGGDGGEGVRGGWVGECQEARGTASGQRRAGKCHGDPTVVIIEHINNTTNPHS